MSANNTRFVIKPAIRVGWNAVHPQGVIVDLASRNRIFWDIGQLRASQGMGFEPYLRWCFQYAKNNGMVPLFIWAQGSICGFILIAPQDKKPGHRTVAAVCISDDARNGFIASNALETVFQLIPANWCLALSRDDDQASFEFWQQALAGINLTRATGLDREEQHWCFESPVGHVPWDAIWFGVEFEFIGARKRDIPVPPGWGLTAEEWLFANGPLRPSADGDPASPDVETADGAELRTPPLQFGQIGQLKPVLDSLRTAGGHVNYSCALHIHLALQHWGDRLIPAIIESAIHNERALAAVLGSSQYRRLFCQPYDRDVPKAYQTAANERQRYQALKPRWEPFLRYGINLASYWNRQGSVEFRYANGSLDYEEVANAVELYLRYLAVIQHGVIRSSDEDAFLEALGIPRGRRYPLSRPIPRDFAAAFPYWYRLEEPSVFNLYDDEAEDGDEYLHSLGRWLEYTYRGATIESMELRLRYKLDGERFLSEVRDQGGAMLAQLEEPVSPKGASTVADHIAAHGDTEAVRCHRVDAGYLDNPTTCNW